MVRHRGGPEAADFVGRVNDGDHAVPTVRREAAACHDRDPLSCFVDDGQFAPTGAQPLGARLGHDDGVAPGDIVGSRGRDGSLRHLGTA
ncbi:hypothetical protein GCM10010376_58530 [Streptomyces violaceusniger]